MASYTFTVTEIVYGFTATVATAVDLTLTETPDEVLVTQNISTITQTSTVQTVIVTGAGSGQSFNQSLNTTDDVTFNSVTTNNIFGTTPITFSAGISLANTGTAFVGDIDQGGIQTQFTNQLALLFALLSLDFGTVNTPSAYSIDIGSI